MAVAGALSGFNDIGCTVTPIFFGYIILSTVIFYVQQKNEENLSTRSLNFLQNAPLNSILFSSSFICVVVSNAS